MQPSTEGAAPSDRAARAPESARPRWLGTALLIGALYLILSLVTGALAGAASSPSLRVAWRWSAFAIAAVVFAAHLANERLRLRNGSRASAWHVAVAVALGALGLALSANVHELRSAAGYRPRMLIALVAWPLLTALPAFVVALVVAAALGVKRPRA